MFPRQNQVQTKKKEEEENKTGSSADFVNTILSTGNENAGKLLLGEAEKKPVPVEPAKIENKIDDEEDDDLDWGALDDEPVQQEVQQEVKNEVIKEAEKQPEPVPVNSAKSSENKEEAEKKKDEDEDEFAADMFALDDDVEEKKEAEKQPEPVPVNSAKSENKKEAEKKEAEDEDEDFDFGDWGDDPEEEIKEEKKQPEKAQANSAKSENKAVEQKAEELPKYGGKDPKKDVFAGDEPAKQILYKDPDIDDPDFDHFDRNNPLNQDMVVEHPGKLKKKKKKSGGLSSANKTQQKIAGLNIGVHKLAPRNKGNGFKRFLTNLAIATGASLGRAVMWLGSAVKRIFNKKYREEYRQGKSARTENPNIQQDARRHDIIPGWNGETYQNGADDILADFRRIPTVWSRLTAAQAADRDGKPLAPKISIYVRQVREAVDEAVNGIDAGHTGIGIEYSRYSRMSNRYERYKLRYGFFPITQSLPETSLAMTGGALIPGQLKDENGSNYSVRRTYPATARQVNAVLKASETYADGGYNSFTRNCTTFVKDMVQKEAGIPAGDKIFEQEAPNFSAKVNFAMLGAKAYQNTSRLVMEKRFSRLGSDKDMSYGGDGNYRVNQQDYRQYKESLANNSGFVGMVDLPNIPAENMRRMEGKDAGEIGSKTHFGTAVSKNNGIAGLGGTATPEMNAENLRNGIKDESRSLINTILSVTGKESIEELCAEPGIDRQARNILMGIGQFDVPFAELSKMKKKDPNLLRSARVWLEKEISDLNALLFTFFKNDARVHLPIMHMISLIEWGIEFVDKEYQKTNLDAGGELGQIRDSMNKNAYIEYQKQDPNDPNAKKTVNTMMNPTRYEAYLQIYKSPDKAIDNYSTYVKLRDKKDPRSPDEEKEFQKLKRIDDLADAYVASHRYMLEKDSYNQQDVDYTFALEKMEKKIPTLGQLRKNTASAIYKSLMLEKIFGNVSQRLENNFTQKDMSDKKKVQEWLDNDMCTCIGRRPAEMKTVIKGIKKAMPELDEAGLQVYLMDMINDRWIKIFSDNAKNTADKDSPLKKAHSPVSTGFDKIKKDANSKLSKKLKDMIHSLD